MTDMLATLRRRRNSWAAAINLRGEYAAMAPRIVAELDAEIAALLRLRESAKAADNGDGVKLTGLSREKRRSLLSGEQP